MDTVPTVSPWRSQAALGSNMANKIKPYERLRRGPTVLGMDAKMFFFLVPHILVPVLMWHAIPHFQWFIELGMQPEHAPTAAVLPAILFVVLQTAAFLGYFHLYNSNPGWVTGSTPGRNPHQPCRFCGAAQSLRCRHDRMTARCVHKMDHHCWFLSTTIGDANHRLFWAFLAIETTLSWWMLLEVVSVFWECMAYPLHGTTFPLLHFACHRRTTSDVMVVSILLLAALVAVYFFTHLLLLHSYLAATNQTTVEVIKGVGVPYLYPFYLDHRGPMTYQVLNWSHLIKLLISEARGRGPPKPFSAGLSHNLQVFFLGLKPYNYKYMYGPPPLVGEEGAIHTVALRDTDPEGDVDRSPALGQAWGGNTHLEGRKKTTDSVEDASAV